MITTELAYLTSGMEAFARRADCENRIRQWTINVHVSALQQSEPMSMSIGVAPRDIGRVVIAAFIRDIELQPFTCEVFDTEPDAVGVRVTVKGIR